MKPAMYIFVNRGLRMSPGKIAAQAGHAATEATLLSHPHIPQPDLTPYGRTTGDDYEVSPEVENLGKLWHAWRTGLHYAKYVMEARDNEHIRDIDTYLRNRGFRTALILDEGHTEVPPISPTALGVALVDKDDPHTAATFSSFSLYKEPRPPKTPEPGTYPPQRAPRGEVYTAPGREGGRIMNAAGGFLRAIKDVKDPGGRSSL